MGCENFWRIKHGVQAVTSLCNTIANMIRYHTIPYRDEIETKISARCLVCPNLTSRPRYGDGVIKKNTQHYQLHPCTDQQGC